MFVTPTKGIFNLSLPSLRLTAQDQALSGWLKSALSCGAKMDIKKESRRKKKMFFFKQLSGTFAGVSMFTKIKRGTLK